jgi:4-hydroxybenzoate polyprenyltransferase
VEVSILEYTRTVCKAIRIYQWSKNVLVFVPIIAAHKIFIPAEFVQALAAFAAFCCAASSTYLLNDILDLAADRAHPRKRNRPLANGDISIATAWTLIALLLSLSLIIAFSLSKQTLGAIIAYMLISTLYTITLKEYPILDVFILAALYTFRIIAGAVATNIYPSMWLLSFSLLLFLSLAFLKRFVEVANDLPSTALSRRGYLRCEGPLILSMGISSSYSATVILALYVQESANSDLYKSPDILWLIVPLHIFWNSRLWLAAQRRYVTDDPLLYAARDWVSQLALLSGALIVFLSSHWVWSW